MCKIPLWSTNKHVSKQDLVLDIVFVPNRSDLQPSAALCFVLILTVVMMESLGMVVDLEQTANDTNTHLLAMHMPSVLQSGPTSFSRGLSSTGSGGQAQRDSDLEALRPKFERKNAFSFKVGPELEKYVIGQEAKPVVTHGSGTPMHVFWIFLDFYVCLILFVFLAFPCDVFLLM